MSLIAKRNKLKKPYIRKIKTDTGVSSDDLITSDDTPVIVGFAKPKSVVRIFVDGVKVGKIKANKKGKFKFKLDALEDGTHKVKFKAEKKGKVKKTKDTIEIDTETETPTVGPIHKNLGNSDAILLTFVGTAEAGAAISLFSDGALVGSAVAGADGDWVIGIKTDSFGTRKYEAKAEDTAGNTNRATITVDGEDPMIPADQSFAYDENRAAGAVLGTVVTSDNVGVTGFAIIGGNGNGWFAIDAGGNITMTAAGTASVANDFETGNSSFPLTVRATDAGGNTADQDVTMIVEDVDEIDPFIIPGQSFAYEENQEIGDILGVVVASDNVAVTGFAITRGNDDGWFAIDANGFITLTAAGAAAAANDWETEPNDFTLTVAAFDAVGNTVARKVTLEVLNLADTDAENAALAEVLEDSAEPGGNNNENGVAVTSAQLALLVDRVLVGHGGIQGRYQAAIRAKDDFTDPPALADIQALVDAANSDLSFLFDTTLNVPSYITNWDVSRVTDMQSMFTFTNSVLGDVSGWDVGNVTNMDNMFSLSITFNQNLGGWDISSLTTADGMLDNSSMNTGNFDRLLAGWATLDTVAGETAINSHVPLGALGRGYTDVTSFNHLAQVYEWSIKNAARRATDSDGKPIRVGSNNADELDFSSETAGQTIHALHGSDIVKGGEGDDTIVGGQGGDNLTGNGGADTFVYKFDNAGQDVIEDFSAGDTIDISQLILGYEPGFSDLNDYVTLSESGTGNGEAFLIIDKYGDHPNDGTHGLVMIELRGIAFAGQTINEVAPGVFDLAP